MKHYIVIIVLAISHSPKLSLDLIAAKLLDEYNKILYYVHVFFCSLCLDRCSLYLCMFFFFF